MHTVCETHSFKRAAKAVGMSEAEIMAVISVLTNDPLAGDVIQGTGGCRKIRVAGKQKGKRGGFRTITFYTGIEIPVFLLTVLSKGERANLTNAESNALLKLTESIVAEYKTRIVKVSVK